MKRAAADGLVKPRFECPIHADYKTYRKYTLEGLAINLEIITCEYSLSFLSIFSFRP